MIKRIFIFILFFFSSFFISCTNDASLELMIFVDAMGLDYDTKTDEYILYYHIASTNSLVTTELGSSGNNKTYSIAHVKANNIYDCINKITNNSLKNIDINHVQSIVLTDEFITMENLFTLNIMIKTYKFFAPNVYIFCTYSDINNLFSVENPENISPFFSLISSNDYISTYNITYYTEFASSLYEDRIITNISVINCDDNIWQNGKDKIYTIYPTGNLFVKKDDSKVFIDQNEYKAMTILNHEYLTTLIYEDINFSLYNCKIKRKEKDGTFIIKISGNIYASNINSINYKEIIKIFEENVIKDFNKLIQFSKENNVDIFQLEDFLYRIRNKKDSFDLNSIDIKIETNFKILT